jgi:hypothetical protein
MKKIVTLALLVFAYSWALSAAVELILSQSISLPPE